MFVGRLPRRPGRFRVGSQRVYVGGIGASVACALVATAVAGSGLLVGWSAVALGFAGLFVGWSLSGSV